jgi:hypothetical protein
MTDISFEGVPILTPADVHEKYQRWNAGERVRSDLVALGQIALTPDEQWVLDRDLYRQNFIPLEPRDSLGRTFGNLRATLRVVARADMDRAGVVDPALDQVMHGGYFRRQEDREGWHINGSPEPTVLYTVVHGAAPTRGLLGELSLDDIIWEEGPDFGHFKPDVPIGQGQRLEPVDFASGTVLRYTTIDGHASGDVNGGRMASQVKVILPPQQ